MCEKHVSAVQAETAASQQDWRSRGWYKVQGKCCVCGSRHMVGMEPRFGYEVCEEHSSLAPAEINRLRKS